MTVTIGIALAGAVVLIGVLIFNKLIMGLYLVKEALSGIDVQLKRRHDLIPNIIETVKGYSRYEGELFEKVSALRSRLGDASEIGQKMRSENELSRALKGIFALAEAYPDLKANKGFLDLQKTLSEIEDQIQLSRRYYNGTVRNYNILIFSFPGVIIARLFGFKEAAFFELEYATERATPDVNF